MPDQETHHDHREPSPKDDLLYPTSPWTLIIQAKGGNTEALGDFLAQYHKPLYVRALRSQGDHHDAQDAVASFFASFCEGESKRLAAIEGPEKGRMREYLGRCFGNFLRDIYRKNNSKKRGGDATEIAVNDPMTDLVLSCPNLSPDEALDARWALEIQHRVKLRFAGEYRETPELARQVFGKQATGISNQKLADSLGFTLKQLRTRLEKMKEHFWAMHLEEVAATVDDPSMVDAEMEVLINALQMLSSHKTNNG